MGANLPPSQEHQPHLQTQQRQQQLQLQQQQSQPQQLQYSCPPSRAHSRVPSQSHSQVSSQTHSRAPSQSHSRTPSHSFFPCSTQDVGLGSTLQPYQPGFLDHPSLAPHHPSDVMFSISPGIHHPAGPASISAHFPSPYSITPDLGPSPVLGPEAVFATSDDAHIVGLDPSTLAGDTVDPPLIPITSSNLQLRPNTPSLDPSFGAAGSVTPSYLLNPSLMSSPPQPPPDHSVDPLSLIKSLDGSLPHSQPQQSPSTPSTNLLSPSHHQPAVSVAGSPSTTNGGGFTPSHSRNTSLAPSSAALGSAYNVHRRVPSDQYSDLSSVHPSPYLQSSDGVALADSSVSPLMTSLNDPQLDHGAALFEQFSISGITQLSPAVTPHLTPHVTGHQTTPQQQIGFSGPEDLMFAHHFPQQYISGAGHAFQSNREPFPSMAGTESLLQFDLKDAAPVTDPPASNAGSTGITEPALPTPDIQIQFAPPSRQASFGPSKPETSHDTLSPPDRGRNRGRAKSDPNYANRPALSVQSPNRLSPFVVKSRSPSPSRVTKNRRSSMSNLSHSRSSSTHQNRDYILGLADRSRPGSVGSELGGVSGGAGGGGSKRTQKHPATFQCSLCPKRFTRAYNLRSHLRTHTDERPFVCGVCGKAFARQHDRKRHEWLHSGEKKFVCSGKLKDGSDWGCARRFARADALGRHFRSEAGRACIRPLLEEEARDKGPLYGNQNGGSGLEGLPPNLVGVGLDNGHIGGLGADSASQHKLSEVYSGLDGGGGGGDDSVPYRLPAALLAQYPSLQTVWNALPSSMEDWDDGPSQPGGDLGQPGGVSDSGLLSLDPSLDEKWAVVGAADGGTGGYF